MFMHPKTKTTCALDVMEADFEREVVNSPQPVLVAFWAPWSRPCRVLDTALCKVATACADTVKIVKVNADDNPDLSLWYDVESVPTLLYFLNGKLCGQLVGTASKEAILAKLQRVVNQAASSQPSGTAKVSANVQQAS